MQERRNTIYIDAANLILGSKNFIPTTYDIFYLLVYLKDKYRAQRCVYFTGKFNEYEIDYEFLRVLGVEIVFKKLYRQDEKTKANCDVEISHRITLDIKDDLVDKVILVSGDGDFAPLLDYVISNKKEANLFAISRKSTAYILAQRKFLKMVYLEDIVNLLIKGKGPAGHVVPEGKLFIKSSITPPQNLSSQSGRIVERKVNAEFFEIILSGKKKFETRLGDLDIKEGDTLLLREVKDGIYTGREVSKKVLYTKYFKVQDYHWKLEDIIDKGLVTISFD